MKRAILAIILAVLTTIALPGVVAFAVTSSTYKANLTDLPGGGEVAIYINYTPGNGNVTWNQTAFDCAENKNAEPNYCVYSVAFFPEGSNVPSWEAPGGAPDFWGSPPLPTKTYNGLSNYGWISVATHNKVFDCNTNYIAGQAIVYWAIYQRDLDGQAGSILEAGAAGWNITCLTV